MTYFPANQVLGEVAVYLGRQKPSTAFVVMDDRSIPVQDTAGMCMYYEYEYYYCTVLL